MWWPVVEPRAKSITLLIDRSRRRPEHQGNRIRLIASKTIVEHVYGLPAGVVASGLVRKVPVVRIAPARRFRVARLAPERLGRVADST